MKPTYTVVRLPMLRNSRLLDILDGAIIVAVAVASWTLMAICAVSMAAATALHFIDMAVSWVVSQLLRWLFLPAHTAMVDYSQGFDAISGRAVLRIRVRRSMRRAVQLLETLEAERNRNV